MVSGLLTDTESYAFLVYRYKEGTTSAPSEPVKFKMIDHFGDFGKNRLRSPG